jgi:hypothetical protein
MASGINGLERSINSLGCAAFHVINHSAGVGLMVGNVVVPLLILVTLVALLLLVGVDEVDGYKVMRCIGIVMAFVCALGGLLFLVHIQSSYGATIF